MSAEARERHKNTRFLMIVNGERTWMTFQDCYHALDSGWVPVRDGALAIDVEGTGVERRLTEQEKNDITRAADELSYSK